MLSFLFWNIYGKQLGELITSLVRERNIDIILLAECEDPVVVLENLNQSGFRKYNFHPDPIGRIKVFSRLPHNCLEPLGNYSGLSFWRLIPPLGKDILLIGAHLPSKIYKSEKDQSFESRCCIEKIKDFEDRLRHQRTVIVGDLNMNPFQGGLTNADGYHAVSSRHIAMRKSRVIKGNDYYFFYNPMWSFLGDRDQRTPGTYYFDNPSASEFYWNTFDQVLIRPDLLTALQSESVEIVTTIENIDLLDMSMRPNKNLASDHLPILFSMELWEVSNDR